MPIYLRHFYLKSLDVAYKKEADEIEKSKGKSGKVSKPPTTR